MEPVSSLVFVYFVERSSLPTILSRRHFLVNLVFLCRRTVKLVIVYVVASVTMSATISTGINITIEVHGVNAQVHATVPERGDLTFVLLPSETYHVHLHDVHGRLVVALRLRIPGPVGNNGVDGGSGRVVRQARRNLRGGARLRGARRVPGGACGSGSHVSGRGVRDGQSSQGCETRGLPPNMAIRTMDQSPRSPASSSSEDSDDNVNGNMQV